MKITVEELEKLRTCTSGLHAFKAAHPTGEATLLEALESNGLGDVLWYLNNTAKLNEQQRSNLDEWTRHQALSVAHLIKSDRKDLIIQFLKTGENREEARKAAAEAAESAWATAAESAAATWAATWAAKAVPATAAWAARAAGIARETQPDSLRELLKGWEQ